MCVCVCVCERERERDGRVNCTKCNTLGILIINNFQLYKSHKEEKLYSFPVDHITYPPCGPYNFSIRRHNRKNLKHIL